jgi:hypothetical protein
MTNTNNPVDVIILSLVKDDKSFKVTKDCVDSYLRTAGELINKIYVVETNPDFDRSYGHYKVEVIKPNKEFNYNEFYNIALAKCTGEFVIGPNNDLIIHEGCIQRIVKEFRENPTIHSISPIDRNWHMHTHMYLPNEDKLYYGMNVSLHMFGCIFCCRRSVFEKIGYLDETFYFFYQDNDYVMSLERNGLNHGVLTGARVTHKTGNTNDIADTKFKYLPENMHFQGELLHRKWNAEPFCSGGYKKYKEYTMEH